MLKIVIGRESRQGGTNPGGTGARCPAAVRTAGALSLVLLLGLAGCGPRSDAPGGEAASASGEASGEAAGETPAAASGGTVVVPYPLDIQGVNELITTSTPIQTALLYFGLFSTLLEEHPNYEDGPPAFTPKLAESYELSPDRLTLTFRLRPDAVWSDGVPITAEDVRWTWEAQNHPEVLWSFADAKDRITDVEVVDRLTVRYRFSEVYATQLFDANMGVILPKHAWSRLPFSEWRRNPTWFLDNLVVSGPFTLESWEPGQRYVLRRNDRYHVPGLPKVERIVFQVVSTSNGQLAMMRSGEGHYMEFVPPAEVATVESVPTLRLEGYIPRFFYFVTWNVRRPLFSDPAVRRALTMGIDRQTIIDSLQYGYAHPSHSPFTSNVWVHHDGIEPWPYDPGRAKELLASRGWTDGDGDGVLDRDGEPFRFTLVTNTANPLRKDIMLMIQEQLGRIGIDVQTQLMDFQALLGPLQEHRFDAVIGALAMDTSLNTRYFFHSQAIDDGFNWGAYSNPEMDRLIEKIEAQVDLEASLPLYLRIQELLHEEQPLTFLYQAERLGAIHERLRDVDPNSASPFYNMARWRLLPEE